MWKSGPLSAKVPVSTAVPTLQFKPLVVGAGGLITGVHIAQDGSVVCRCDTFGAYLWNQATLRWSQLCTTVRLPASVTGPGQNNGVYEIQFAPNNSSVIYMCYGQLNGSGASGMLVSSNGGASFQLTPLLQVMSPNLGSKRKYGPHGAVDPINADVCILVPDANGAFATANGTAGASSSWPAITGIASNDAGNCGVVAFDTTGGSTSGKTNNIYIGISGTGLYKSTNAGVSYALVANKPAGISLKRIKIASDGTVYCVTYTGTNPEANGSLYKLTFPAGVATWTDITPTALVGLLENVILDPNAVAHLIAIGFGLPFQDSTNAGGSWTQAAQWTYTPTDTRTLAVGTLTFNINPGQTGIVPNQGVAIKDQSGVGGQVLSWAMASVTSYNSGTGLLTLSVSAINGVIGAYSSWVIKNLSFALPNYSDIPYLGILAPALGIYPSPGFLEILPDPSSSKVYGVGDQTIMQMNLPFALDGTVPATDIGLGIEQLAAKMVVAPPGGSPICCAEDIGFLKISAIGTPVQKVTIPATFNCFLNEGWAADWATTDPTFLVGVIASFTLSESYIATSSDGGTSWTLVPTHVGSLFGGTVAAYDHLNFVYAPSSDTPPQYTLDGGLNWHDLTTLGGQTPNGGFGHNSFSPGSYLTVDRVAANTFYLFNNGGGTGGGQGSYSSVNGGVTWTYHANTLSSQGFNWLKCPFMVPSGVNTTGHLFLCSYGFSGGSWAGPNTASVFNRSTDGGATWAAILPATGGFPAIAEVWAFGFGAPAPGHTYASVVFYGFYNTGSGWVRGLYRSIDNCATWQNISADYPDTWTDWITDITGDPLVFGTYYFTKSGSSYGVGQLI